MEVAKVGETVKKPWKANGDFAKRVYDWFGEDLDLTMIMGPFSKVEFSEPDLGSRQKLIKQLTRHGWQPEIFTEKTGAPKLTEQGKPVESLFKIEAPVGKQVARWYILKHRMGQINGWINNVRPDGRITAGANSCGTNTVRMRHKILTNVPKADPKVIFGKEMRELFIARKGYKLLGYDAAALEARCMAHYTYKFDGGEFADLILNGDYHASNARIFFEEETEGLEVDSPEFKSYRSIGKNGTYALTYGGQPKKLASTLGVPLKKGKYLFDKFWKKNEALGELRQLVIKMTEARGWVPGIDGRKIYTRSSHSALNALFQSCGAIIMKVSMVELDRSLKEEEIHHYKVMDFHDEGQHEVDERECYIDEGGLLRHRLGDLAVQSLEYAGRELSLNCEITGDYEIGDSWKDTH